MKLFNKIALCALAGMAFTACSDDIDWTPGLDDGLTASGDSVQSVAFEQSTLNVEKDPLDPTTTMVRLVREYTATTDTVPVVILTNTDSVFTLEPLVFEAGDSVATLQIDYANAEVGKPYTLELIVKDSRYVSQYSNNNSFSMNVTRVKWNNIEGDATIKDNFLTNLFGGLGKFGVNPTATIQVRDDDSTQFRIHHAYHDMLTEYGGHYYSFTQLGLIDGSDPNASEYLSFRLLKPGQEFRGETIAKEDLVYFDSFNTGIYVTNYSEYIYYNHNALYLNPESEDSKKKFGQDTWVKSYVVAYQENGLPGKIQLAPDAYMPAAGGGWDNTQKDNIVTIFFPGYKDPVNVKIAEDFEWEEVFTGDYVSEMMDGRGSATLYKGVKCTQTTDGADTVFANTYGTAYKIESPYAEDYDLFFAVDAEGNIQIPEDVTLQNTGVTAMKDTIYAKINGNKSTFTERQIALNITFTNNDETVEYSTTDEVIQYITYSPVGTVDYMYFNYFYGYNEETEEYYPVMQKDIVLEKRDDRDDWFVMRGWAGGQGDCHILIDPETNVVTVPIQAFIDGDNGQIIYGDMYTIGQQVGQAWPESTFDPETNIASLFMFYQDAENAYYDPEYPEAAQFHFTPVSAEQAKALKKAHKAKSLKGKNAKKARKTPAYLRKLYRNPWANAKKVNTIQPMVLKNI